MDFNPWSTSRHSYAKPKSYSCARFPLSRAVTQERERVQRMRLAVEASYGIFIVTKSTVE